MPAHTIAVARPSTLPSGMIETIIGLDRHCNEVDKMLRASFLHCKYSLVIRIFARQGAGTKSIVIDLVDTYNLANRDMYKFINQETLSHFLVTYLVDTNYAITYLQSKLEEES